MSILRSIFYPSGQRTEAEEAIQSEQHRYWQEYEHARAEFKIYNARFVHDPFWRTRFWSIQSAHDAAAGRGGHWFWRLFSYVFALAQISFVAGPAALVVNRRGQVPFWAAFVAASASAWLLLVSWQRAANWLYWVRFDREDRRSRGRLYEVK